MYTSAVQPSYLCFHQHDLCVLALTEVFQVGQLVPRVQPGLHYIHMEIIHTSVHNTHYHLYLFSIIAYCAILYIAIYLVHDKFEGNYILYLLCLHM